MKKGVADTNKQLFWTIFALPIATFLILIMIFSIPSLIDSRTKISDRVEDNLIHDKIKSSPDCLGYLEHMTVRTRHIDLNKFTQENLNKCLIDYELKRPFSLRLIYKDTQKTLLSPNFHQTNKQIQYDRPVIVINNEERHNGFLEIKMFYD